MGFFQKILQALGLVKKEARIIVVGLDNSGKSTLINSLTEKRTAVYEVAPTVGFNVEQFDRGKLRFTVIDMSGASTYRSLWETYYTDVQAIMFVVDAADKIRVCVARDELEALLLHKDIQKTNAPILLFANKLDVPGALEPTDLTVLLNLPAIKDRAWQIQGCVALTGEGVEPGVAWLVEQLNRKVDSGASSSNTSSSSSSSSSNSKK